MYIVVSVEHSGSFDDIPMLIGQFNTLGEAKKFKRKKIEESMREFPNEREDCGFLYTEDEAGNIDYGYVITIMEVK